jgi:hypothetical protein
LEVGKTAAIKGSRKPARNEQRGQNRLKRDLMFFWGMHSVGKFDERTISYALDYGLPDVQKELQVLVESGVVEKEVENGVSVYCLTMNEAKRRSIVEWASPGHSGR